MSSKRKRPGRGSGGGAQENSSSNNQKAQHTTTSRPAATLGRVSVMADKMAVLKATLAAIGVPNLPLLLVHPGKAKKPLKGGKRDERGNLIGPRWDATTDLEQIERDLRRWPDMNIGIATGDVTVIDEDTVEGHNVDGSLTRRRHEKEHGAWPDTLMVRTGTGSVHRYYLPPTDVTVRNGVVGPGIERQGEGGYVLIPPSVSANGKPYVCINPNTAIAPLPASLVPQRHAGTEQVKVPQELQIPIKYIRRAAKLIPNPAELDRPRWVTFLHAFKGASGDSEEGYEVALEWSEKWPDYNPRYDEEATRKAWDGIKKVRVLGGQFLVEQARKIDPKFWPSYHPLWATAADYFEVEPDDAAEAAGDAAKTAEGTGFPFETLAEIVAAKLEDPLRRVSGLIGEGNHLTEFYGPSTVGKTFLAVSLVGALLQGNIWFGRKTLKCGVLYVCREGAMGFRNRMKAYAKRWLEGADLDQLPFAVITMPVDLGPASEKQHELKLIETIKTMNAKWPHRPVGIVVYDNKRSTAPGMDENSSDDNQAFYAKVRRVAVAAGGSPIVLHNTGKDVTRGSRGSSAAKDLPDTVLEVGRSNGGRWWAIDKVRDGDDSLPREGFVLEKVELGTVQDADGQPKAISSAVVVPFAIAAFEEEPKKRWERALQVLQQQVRDHGMIPLGSKERPTDGTLCLDLKDFRKALQEAKLLPQELDAGATEAQQRRRHRTIAMSFKRLRDELREEGVYKEGGTPRKGDVYGEKGTFCWEVKSLL